LQAPPLALTHFSCRVGNFPPCSTGTHEKRCTMRGGRLANQSARLRFMWTAGNKPAPIPRPPRNGRQVEKLAREPPQSSRKGHGRSIESRWSSYTHRRAGG